MTETTFNNDSASGLDNPKLDVGNALEFLPQGIRIIDMDYSVRYVNRSFAQISRMQPEEALGKKCWEVFHNHFCHTPQCRLARISADGDRLLQAEIERQNEDGAKIHYMISAFPLYAPSGRLIGIMESVRDITEKKALEALVVEAEERYRAMVELTGEVGEGILMITDASEMEGTIIFASEQSCRITGYRKEELLGSRLFDLVSPADRKASLDRHRLKMNGESLPGLYEISILKKDGTEVPVELTSAVTIYKGEPVNVVYLRDITERKALYDSLAESEKSLKTLFNHLPIATWEANLSNAKSFIESLQARGTKHINQSFSTRLRGPLYQEFASSIKHTRINQAALDICGFSNDAQGVEDFRQWFAECITSKSCCSGNSEYIVTPIFKGRTPFECEYSFETRNGSLKTTLLKASIPPGHETDLTRVFFTLYDITKLRQTEASLKMHQENLELMVAERTSRLESEIEKRTKTESQLKEALKVKSKLHRDLQSQINRRVKFTRALVHELKTPLMPMIGASEALFQELSQEPLASYARVMYQGSCQLEKRIDELLDIAKGEIGMLKIHPCLINPVELLREVAIFIQAESVRYGQSLDIQFPQKMKQFRADPERLEQILLNLLNNAFKFTPEKGTIGLKAYQDEKSTVFEITDTGIGITNSDGNKRLSSHSIVLHETPKSRGMGIGLSLSQMLVELHHGRIDIFSKAGKGTRVVVYIPFELIQHEADNTKTRKN